MKKKVWKQLLSLALALTMSLAGVAALGTKVAVAAGKKKTVYVITKVTSNGKLSEAFSYNKKGLLTKKVMHSGGSSYVYKYSYNKKNNITKRVGNEVTTKFTYNKKGQLIKRASSDKYTYTYTYKGNNLKQYAWKISGKDEGKYVFTVNSKGLPTKITYKDATSTYTTTGTHSYDKKGNEKTFVNGDIKNTYTYTYKKTSIKRVDTFTYGSSTSKYTDVYTLKKMKVPSGVVKKIKAQQWALMNNDYFYIL